MLGRRQALDRLRRKKVARSPPVDEIERRGARRAPLSFAQERLWFLDQLDRGAARFNILSAIHFRGRLRVAALEASLAEMVRRHEILRTTFTAESGAPEQVVAPRLDLGLPRVDLSRVPSQRQGRHLSCLYRAEAQRLFDLAAGPLARWTVLVLGPREHVLVLVMHQIVSDRWSRGIFVKEVAALYQDVLAGRPFSLPEPQLQYADFAFWQKRHLSPERLAPHLDHWRRRLQDAPLLELPSDRSRPPVSSHRGGMIYKVIEPPLLARLERFCRDHGLTLFMTLLAAVVALLQRYSGQTDFTLGAPVAQRQHRQVADLIGFFINMVPLRCRASADDPFVRLAGEARAVALDAFSHGEVPFEQVVEALVDGRDMSRHPLFQVAVVLQNTPLPALSLPDLEIGLAEVDWGTTAFDLSFFFWETALWEHLEAGLSLTVTYSTDLFDASTVHRLCAHLRAVLDGVTRDSEAPLSELALLTSGERHQLLREWSGWPPAGAGRPATPGREATLRSGLRRVAARGSEVALSDGERSLTWDELADCTGRVARGLRRHGVGPEVCVATCLEGFDQVVALLSIVEAGGCYVPIDPTLPKERVAQICAGAGVERAIAPVHAVHGADIRRLDLDELAEEAAASESLPPLESEPDQLAYVLSTSGSTGRPKSVGVSHRAVVNLVEGGPRLLRGERVAQLASTSFDAATFEIWAALLSGASLEVVDPRSVLEPQAFSACIQTRQLDVVFLTTAFFHHLAGRRADLFRPLRCLIFGGETVRPDLVAAVRRACPALELWHAYGPTEAATFATLHRVSGRSRGAAGDVVPVPIGRPLAGSRVYVLDPEGHPLPLGASGEVWIGGAGLARGYLGMPGATALAFRPDPYGPGPGARLHRTGDRARYTSDGELVFQGRLDRRLKVRGFRIEPREIEDVLLDDPAVEEAVVTATPSAALVAHVVLRNGASSVDPQRKLHDLSGLLRRRLPAYMVPSVIAFPEALPRTASGKVDRAALERSREAAGALRPVTVPPRDTRERELADLFRRALGKQEEVGIYDDFFALGGHSLSAAEVIAGLPRRHGAPVDLMTFFEHPTVAGLTAVLAEGEPAREVHR